MNIKPIQNRIFVLPTETEKQTESGLFVGLAKEEGVIEGRVVAVGPGKYDQSGEFIDVPVAVGDRVLFNGGAGFKVKHDGVEYNVITENEIVTVVV